MIESRVLCASDIGAVYALRGVLRMVGWFLCSPVISFLFFVSLGRIVLDFRAKFLQWDIQFKYHGEVVYIQSVSQSHTG